MNDNPFVNAQEFALRLNAMRDGGLAITLNDVLHAISIAVHGDVTYDAIEHAALTRLQRETRDETARQAGNQ